VYDVILVLFELRYITHILVFIEVDMVDVK